MKMIAASLKALGSMFFILSMLVILSYKICSQTALPIPDHIVVVFLENTAFSEIIGSEAAPFINTLANDTGTAIFLKSYGIEHPSQPNYLHFYSGSNQGVTDNEIPLANPFTTPNLGRQLIDSGMTFTTFSEDLPYAGYNEASFGHYVRKHNPAANWMGTETNQIPEATNQPFTAFPFADFTLLPTVCFVMPNQINNMHDGTYPERVTTGDTWIYENMNDYIEWSRNNNSLFILTFDEDNYASGNHIATIFTGQMVMGGEYADSINHYTILRTIEDMYGLPHAGNAAIAEPVTDCWIGSNDVNDNILINKSYSVYPNPSKGSIEIALWDLFRQVDISIFNSAMHVVHSQSVQMKDKILINLDHCPPGIYFISIPGDDKNINKKLILY
jgi:hypothetical protein